MHPFDETQRSLNKTAIESQTILSGQYWGELRVFLAVAKSRSYSKAAELIGTSQPTVSRTVKRLQDVVGSQLVVPTRQGIILTAAGEKLAHSLAALDQTLFDITADLKSEKTHAEGHVRISVTEGLNAFFLAPTLKDFVTSYPKIQMSLKHPHSLIDLRENQTDMMVGFMPTESADVEVRRLGTLHLVPMATVDYVEKCGLPTHDNISSHTFLQCEYYTARTGLWDPWMNLSSRANRIHHCDESFGYAMIVKSGLGIGLLGTYISVWSSLVPLDLGVHIPVKLYAIALRERLASRPVRLAFDWVTEIFSTNPWFADDLRFKVQSGKHDLGIRLMSSL